MADLIRPHSADTHLGPNTKKMMWLHQVLTCLATTGLRIMELASLRWSDLDMSSRVLLLTDESKRNITNRAKRRTKSGESRSFPIHDDLWSVLQQMERSSDGYVFHGPHGGRIKPDTVRNILTREILNPLEPRFPSASDEIGFMNGRLHSFRHFFCSICSNSGVPEQVLCGGLDTKTVRWSDAIITCMMQSRSVRCSESTSLESLIQLQWGVGNMMLNFFRKEAISPTSSICSEPDYRILCLIGTVSAQSSVPISIRDRKSLPARSLRRERGSKRREGDSNPRSHYPEHSISSAAQSATLPSLRIWTV